MEKTNFENLRVYQLSEELADKIWLIVRAWDNLARDTVGKQIIRAADSIGANIAEGSGRYTFIENRRFAHIARGSLYETKHWLRRAYKRNLLAKKQTEELKPIIDELAPKLNAYINALQKAKQNQNTKTTNHDPRTTIK
ncbi:MAG: four helix bundle protein [Pyrinomonadaceae bacterium]